MTRPKITIVTVCFNAAKTLERTIKSVINQTYDKIEYIIIDGASTDGTIDIIKQFENKISYWNSEPDNGIYDAMNKGIKKASGDWINFMNAGDMFADDNVIKTLFETELDDCGVIYGSWFLKYRNHLSLTNPSPFYENKNKFKGMGFSHQSVFVKLQCALKYMFDTSFKLCADYNMIHKLYYKEKVVFNKVCIPIAIMDEESGATISNYELHYREVARICGCSPSNIEIMYSVIVYKLKRYIKKCIW